MNWDAVGAIAEAVGAIAIFVTLVYLAVQIRQNTKANELAAFERSTESGNRIRELLILNPDLLELSLRGYESYSGLSSMDKIRFGMLMRNIFSAMQGAYMRHVSVRHDPLEFEGTAKHIDAILKNPGARQWLEKTDPDWHPGFREIVEQRLAAIMAAEKSSSA